MQLNTLDWVIVALSLVVSFFPVLLYYRRAGSGTTEFFASGRAAPWWLIGTSMVATTFSTDTPNLVTDFVRTGGVAKNWAWWSFLITGMTTVFFYSRMWRRSGVLTDLEFYELRYSGGAAAFLRGFRAIYLGLFFNCCIMATVTLAAAKIANVMLGWDRMTTVVVCAGICIVFGSMSGLWGVLTTDMIQFAIAMVGVIGAAYYSLQHPAVGGLSGLMSKIPAKTLNLAPDIYVPSAAGESVVNWDMLLPILIIPLTIQWWATWYPGAEPGGGSYIAQRMLAARSERDALAGTLWFNLAHYAVRPWPWIIVALCSMLVFPTLADIRKALPHVSADLIGHDLAYPAMLTLLPHGLLGLLVASLLAAYVSTMTTHMNWGASYLVNDVYRRFALRGFDQGSPELLEKHLVAVSRVVSAILMIVSGALMFVLTTAKEAFDLLLAIGAGTGSIYLLRWFWWRVNAWSEIVGMVASFIAAVTVLILKHRGTPITENLTLVVSVAFTTFCWLIATFLTPPVDDQTLTRFYQRVRPAGPGWTRIRALAGNLSPDDSMPQAFVGVLLGCAFVYSALFGVGYILYGKTTNSCVCGAVAIVSGVGLRSVLQKLWTPRSERRNAA